MEQRPTPCYSRELIPKLTENAPNIFTQSSRCIAVAGEAAFTRRVWRGAHLGLLARLAARAVRLVVQLLGDDTQELGLVFISIIVG